jgi:hypothetical protein
MAQTTQYRGLRFDDGSPLASQLGWLFTILTEQSGNTKGQSLARTVGLRSDRAVWHRITHTKAHVRCTASAVSTDFSHDQLSVTTKRQLGQVFEIFEGADIQHVRNVNFRVEGHSVHAGASYC